jgi:hypothetical protein
MEGRPPGITAFHFHFRLLQSLIIYEPLIPLLHVCEMHGAQLDEDKRIFYLFPTELRNLF